MPRTSLSGLRQTQREEAFRATQERDDTFTLKHCADRRHSWLAASHPCPWGPDHAPPVQKPSHSWLRVSLGSPPKFSGKQTSNGLLSPRSPSSMYFCFSKSYLSCSGLSHSCKEVSPYLVSSVDADTRTHPVFTHARQF